MPRGGKREGAGRKPRTEKFSLQIQRAEDVCAAKLLRNLKSLQLLADGGLEKTTAEEEWAPAGTIIVETLELDKDGKQVRTKKLAYPDHPADELVLVKKRTTTTVLAPDREANQYLIDRVMGKPTTPLEMSIAGLKDSELLEELIDDPDVAEAIADIAGGSEAEGA